MTVTDYIQSMGDGLAFIDESDSFPVPDFIRDKTFQKTLCNVMDMLYGEYHLRNKYRGIYYSNIPIMCNSIYAANAYKYKELYATTQLEYDPIENYNMVEEYTEESTGHTENTMDYGQINQDTTYGEQRTTNTVGQRINTHSVSPDESASFIPESRDENGNYTDDVATKSHIDSFVDRGHTDIESGDVDGKTTHTLTRRGNIGVTTSDQMIAQHRSTADFVIYKIIASDIMSEICLRYLG